VIGLWPERRADQGLERKENRETGVGVSTRTENRYFRIRVQMRCSLSPNRSDVVIGQLVSLEAVQRSDEMPLLGILSEWNKLTNELKVMIMNECFDITLGDLGKRNPSLSLE